MIKICTYTKYEVLEYLSMQEIKHELDKIVSELNGFARNKMKTLKENGFVGVDEIASIDISELSGNRQGYYNATIVINTYDYYMNEEEIKHPLVISRPL